MGQAAIVAQEPVTQPIIWVHGDCLSPSSPALQAYPNAAGIWVWDEALLEEWQLSLKRIVFIYECLLELPITIRRGDVAKEVSAFASEQGADGVVTTESPSPRFHSICQDLEQTMPVVVLPVNPFVPHEGYIDLKRFSRYWRVAQRYLFGPSHG